MKFIAHRINNLEEIDGAKSQQASGIECDVQLTQDNVPVVFHDHYFVTARGKSFSISALTHSQLQLLSIEKKESLYTLDEYLQHVYEVFAPFLSGFECHIELKSREEELVENIIHTINTVFPALKPHIVFLAFKPEQLRKCHEHGFKTCALFRKVTKQEVKEEYDQFEPKWSELMHMINVEKNLPDIDVLAKKLGFMPEYISSALNLLTPEYVSNLQQKGVSIGVWTGVEDDYKTYSMQAVDLGLSFVVTDFIEQVRNFVTDSQEKLLIA